MIRPEDVGVYFYDYVPASELSEFVFQFSGQYNNRPILVKRFGKSKICLIRRKISMKIVLTKKELIQAVVNRVKYEHGEVFDIENVQFFNNERYIPLNGAEVMVRASKNIVENEGGNQ